MVHQATLGVVYLVSSHIGNIQIQAITSTDSVRFIQSCFGKCKLNPVQIAVSASHHHTENMFALDQRFSLAFDGTVGIPVFALGNRDGIAYRLAIQEQLEASNI